MAEEQNLNEMLRLRREKLHDLIDSGNSPFLEDKYDVTHHSSEIEENFEELEEQSVQVAGRIMSKRGHGRVMFMDLQDSQGQIQLFAQKNNLEDQYDEIKDLDIGDIVGVKGEVFKTNTGEISIRAKDFVLLSKSLQILPEKYHGLKDVDLRYRQRYVDLIVNPEVKETFLLRSKIIKAIREFLDKKGYLEVETPILSTVAGGANARPFLTHHNTYDTDMQMRIANELYLKRLIVGGFDKVYEMGKMFRNEGVSTRHNPEFTNMELYKAYGNYEDMMDITEELFVYVAENVLGTLELKYQDRTLDMTPPWKRVSMIDVVTETTGVDFNEIDSDEEAREIAKEKGLDVDPHWTRGHVIAEMFDEFGEETLVQPTFVLHHPVEVSPLAKRTKEDPRVTDRFELFMNGWELANAFSELNDPFDQRKRFEEQVESKEQGDDEAHPMDYDFLNALEVGLPPTGGLGIGVDRMIMIYTNQASIRDILFFPVMRPLPQEVDNKEEKNNIEEIKEEIERSVDLDLSKVNIEPLFEDMVDFDKFSESDFRVVKVLECEHIPKSRNLLKFVLDDGTEEDRIILSGIKDYYNPEDLVGKTLLAITNLPERKMMGEPSQGMLLSAIYEYDGHEALELIMLDDNIPAGAKIY